MGGKNKKVTKDESFYVIESETEIKLNKNDTYKTPVNIYQLASTGEIFCVTSRIKSFDESMLIYFTPVME